MKLAFSTLGCPAWNIETVAEAVVRYGYDAVEWRVVDGSILSPETPEHTLHRLVTLTREYHLSVAAVDTSCQFVQAAGVPEHAILWDLYHTCRAGEAPEQTLDQLGSALAYVHFKDARTSAARGWELVPLGEGTLPLARTIHLLKRRGYTGFLSFEWEKLWHPHLAEPEMVLPQASTLVRRCLQEKAEDSSVAFEEGI